MNVSNKILSDITVYMKYAKYLPEENRRENWDELVTRNMNMHIKKYPELSSEIVDAYNYVQDKIQNMRNDYFKEYGTDNINIQDGTITYPENPNPQEDGETDKKD